MCFFPLKSVIKSSYAPDSFHKPKRDNCLTIGARPFRAKRGFFFWKKTFCHQCFLCVVYSPLGSQKPIPQGLWKVTRKANLLSGGFNPFFFLGLQIEKRLKTTMYVLNLPEVRTTLHLFSKHLWKMLILGPRSLNSPSHLLFWKDSFIFKVVQSDWFFASEINLVVLIKKPTAVKWQLLGNKPFTAGNLSISPDKLDLIAGRWYMFRHSFLSCLFLLPYLL